MKTIMVSLILFTSIVAQATPKLVNDNELKAQITRALYDSARAQAYPSATQKADCNPGMALTGLELADRSPNDSKLWLENSNPIKPTYILQYEMGEKGNIVTYVYTNVEKNRVVEVDETWNSFYLGPAKLMGNFDNPQYDDGTILQVSKYSCKF